ncbi:hypothetical protein [Nocardia farcinica]|nr:hypothetical protein [Nocardia farcinica]MBF6374508.1 hypothetical protein [Nocardia farcinica]
MKRPWFVPYEETYKRTGFKATAVAMPQPAIEPVEERAPRRLILPWGVRR